MMFRGGDSAERKAQFDVFWEVLSRTPPLFVVEACDYAARGGLGRLAFLEPGDLYKTVVELSQRACRPVRKPLPPPVVLTECERMARAAALRELSSEIKAKAQCHEHETGGRQGRGICRAQG